MDNLEKLISNLSNYWDLSPEKVVDRLNHMNESEIKNVVNKMTKKFQQGGYLSNGMPIGNRTIISKTTTYKHPVTDEMIDSAIRAENQARMEQFKREAAELKSRNYQTQMELMERRGAAPAMKTQPSAPEAGSVGPAYYNGPRPKFEDGGMIDCFRRGGKPSECMKCGGKTLKAEDGNKVRRTDKDGYAYTLSDGTDVLTQDKIGIQPLPGSYSEIEGSYPEMETWRTIKTNKGGDPIRYDYKVFANTGDTTSPLFKYTTKNNLLRKIFGWRTITPEVMNRFNAAYSANNLKIGGKLKK